MRTASRRRCRRRPRSPETGRAVLNVALLESRLLRGRVRSRSGDGSASALCRSVDFLADASVNLRRPSLPSPGRCASRARLGMALAGILLVPAAATSWTAWGKFAIPRPPTRSRCRSPGPTRHRQPDLRGDPRAASPPRGKPGPGGVPLGAERRRGECRDHRCRARHGLRLGDPRGPTSWSGSPSRRSTSMRRARSGPRRGPAPCVRDCGERPDRRKMEHNFEESRIWRGRRLCGRMARACVRPGPARARSRAVRRV